VAEQLGIRTGTGKCDVDTGGGLDDAGSDLDQPQADGGEIGGPERGGLRQHLSQSPHQPVGGGVERQPHQVGIGRAARGAVDLHLRLVAFGTVLGLSTGAIERVVDMIGAATLERGDDEADIEAERSGLDARDNPTISFARAVCCVVRLGIAMNNTG